jgi:uncharacterized membrane protein YphA (DoxX/SURF4 family)
VWWILQYRWKPLPTFGWSDGGFCLWLSKEIQCPVVDQYVDLLRLIIIPNPLVAACLVFLIESAIGIILSLGLYTRLGAFVGTLWSLILLIGLMEIPGVTTWSYLSIVLLDILFFSIGAMNQLAIGRVLYTRSW